MRSHGRRAYLSEWKAMRDFTESRTTHTPDELWMVEHEPVYTLGTAADPSHVLRAGSIPVVRSDRGGQVTYHGPGQLVVYVMYDLRRAGVGIRGLVRRLEGAVVDMLAEQGIEAEGRPSAPGVYVGGEKIAALGLRIRHGCSYHGLALNVDMDLSPFGGINPCGHPGLRPTQLAALGPRWTVDDAARFLLPHLMRALG
jgi:lipoyl(octanoyl) transferase